MMFVLMMILAVAVAGQVSLGDICEVFLAGKMKHPGKDLNIHTCVYVCIHETSIMYHIIVEYLLDIDDYFEHLA